jgi:hypothetical protein
MPPTASTLQQSTVDAIVFQCPSEIIYRPHGAHEHVPGQGRVACVTPMQVKRPLTPRPAVIENLCGRFLGPFQRGGAFDPVTLKTPRSFGNQKEMYHLHGSLFLFRQCVHFKGCNGADGIAALARDLGMAEDPRASVYMAVFSLTLDWFIHTYHGCYLENRLSERFGSLRVCHRMMDMNMLVKLRLERFSAREMPGLGEDLEPKSMDVMVSRKGMVLIRMSWSRNVWDASKERRLLDFCNWLGGVVRECC